MNEFCPSCDHGVVNGKVCADCGGTGYKNGATPFSKKWKISFLDSNTTGDTSYFLESPSGKRIWLNGRPDTELGELLLSTLNQGETEILKRAAKAICACCRGCSTPHVQEPEFLGGSYVHKNPLNDNYSDCKASEIYKIMKQVEV